LLCQTSPSRILVASLNMFSKYRSPGLRLTVAVTLSFLTSKFSHTRHRGVYRRICFEQDCNPACA
jgi:hypothetical protein